MTASVHPLPGMDRLIVDFMLQQIVDADPARPQRGELRRELKRLARKHPQYRSALYKAARKLKEPSPHAHHR